jgi:hypothetical protein
MKATSLENKETAGRCIFTDVIIEQNIGPTEEH